MADEGATTSTESSAPAGTETTAANDAAVETSALGGAGADATAATTDATAAPTEAATTEAKPGETDSDGDDGSAKAVVPDAYELTVPEGFTLDAKQVEAVTPVFKELGLSNDQANKLMPVAADFAKSIADGIAAQQLQGVADWRKERFDEARNDPEIGGAKWDETMALSAKALDQFGAPKGSPFRNALDESGWGNHVEMVRMFAKIGAAVGEDSFVRADAGAKTDVPIWDRVYAKPTT